MWLIALERGASGLWHAHVLLADVRGDISALATIWESRNGQIDVQPVTNGPGAVLYTTKEAALSGEILLSDTLASYGKRFTDQPCVALYPFVQEDHYASGSRSGQ